MNDNQRTKVLDYLKQNEGKFISKSETIHKANVFAGSFNDDDLDFLSSCGVSVERIRSMIYFKYIK